MSGAAGLSAAKRRRGAQASLYSEPEYILEHDIAQESVPMHPIMQLQVHDKKLDGLLTHIQQLGAAFLEHKSEVAPAIMQLQDAVEELLRATGADLTEQIQNPPTFLNKTDEVKEEVIVRPDPVIEMLRTTTQELTEKLAMQKSELELVTRKQEDTGKWRTTIEATMAKLADELSDSKRRGPKTKAKQPEKDPTFPSGSSDTDIVKEALKKIEGGSNITLETIEK